MEYRKIRRRTPKISASSNETDLIFLNNYFNAQNKKFTHASQNSKTD